MAQTERAVGWGRERKQHVNYYRKWLLRKRLLRWAVPGAVYVPFIGDGDLAIDLYDQRLVLGADIDGDRVKVAQGRLSGDIRTADCDVWPFPDRKETVAIADFDAWANPWPSFISFFENGEKASRLVVFFTDGHKIPIMGDGRFIHPDGSQQMLGSVPERQKAFYFYLSRCVLPWFDGFIKPYRRVDTMRYLQGQMCYWGAAIDNEE